MKVNVSSEIGSLKSIITRRPGREIELATPDNLEKLLFEDIVDLQIIQEEHDIFTNCLRSMGIEVINFDDLIIEVLEGINGKKFVKNILGRIIKDGAIKELFKSASSFEIKRYLIAGESPIEKLPKLNPAPNFMFIRDIGAIVKDHFLFATTSKQARAREMRIAQETFRFHTRFRDIPIITYPQSNYLEGGDIQPLSKEIIISGISERTSQEAIEMIIPNLHRMGFKYVITVNLDNKRSCMHLDTVFTRINYDECLIFEPIISEALTVVYRENKKPIKTQKGLLQTLSDVGMMLKPILCGGREKTCQIREQWTDGVNSLAVRPGCIFTYRRNRHTIEELKNHDYEVVRAKDISSPLSNKKKYVITFKGNELSRGRGGSHCLTFPINRT